MNKRITNYPDWKRILKNVMPASAVLCLFLGISQLAFSQNYGELKKIFAPDGALDDGYGFSVSVSDSIAIVGMPFDDDNGAESGSAYIYFRNQGGPNNWGFVKKITPNDGQADANFGHSVSVSDTIIIVGAPFDDGEGNGSGAAYIFHRNAGGTDNWGQVMRLTPSSLGTGDNFGYSVSIDGTSAAVGSPLGDQSGNHGSVYVFYKDNGGMNNWGEQLRIDGDQSQSRFGHSVGIRDDLLIAGANEYNGIGSDDGRAYIYDRNTGGPDNWGLVQTLIAPDGMDNDRFGHSVDIDGDRAIVGAPGDDDAENGVNSGSAYIFSRDLGGPDNWGFEIKIFGTSTAEGDEFGWAVSIDGELALVGAPFDDDSGPSSGTTFIFSQNQGGMNNWGETQRLQGDDAVAGDMFGWSLEITGDFLYVGAPSDDDSGVNSGSVYIFEQGEVICDQPNVDCADTTIYLDAFGLAVISAMDIAQNASSSCGFASITLSQSVFNCSDVGMIDITLTVVDIDGNVASCMSTVTVIDSFPPVFANCPADTITVGNDVSNCSANLAFSTPVAFDNCTVDSVVQISGPDLSEPLDLGVHEVTYVAYDPGLLTDTCTFYIEVVDTQAPLLICPSDFTISADPDVCYWSSTNQLAPLAALENCGANLQYEITEPSGLIIMDSGMVMNYDLLVGTTQICYTLTDSAGSQMSSCCFNVTVYDLQDPVIDCPGDDTVINDMGLCSADYSWTIPIPTDNCNIDTLTEEINFADGMNSIQGIDPGNYGSMTNAVLPVGINTITYTTADSSGNMASCSFTVEVLDQEAPVITCPMDATVNTSDGMFAGCTGEYTIIHPDPTDNCALASLEISFLNPDGTVEGPYAVMPGGMQTREYDLGVTQVGYVATDIYGNSSNCVFTVTVVDDEDPVFLTCPPDTLTIGTNVDICGAYVYWAIPVADDNCDVVTVMQTAGPMPGDSLAPGFYPVEYVATDGSGNTDTCSFTLRIIDTQAPLLLCPDDVLAYTDGGTCSWTSPANSLTPSVAIGNCPYEITWEVTNPDGSMSSGSDDVSGYTFALDTSIVCYIITETEDPEGDGFLSDTCCFMVIIRDNINPTISCPPNTEFDDTADGEEDCQHTMSGTGLDATAMDNCSVVSLTHDYAGAPGNTTLDGAVFPVGVTVITWTAVDTAGNTVSCSFTVTVIDNVDPVIICPASADIGTSNLGSTGDCAGQFDWTHPTPTDNCAPTQYNYTIDNADGTVDGPFDLVALLNPNVPAAAFDASHNFPIGVSTVTYFVADAAGNATTCSFTVTVSDDENPVFITCPPDTLAIGTNVNVCGAYVDWAEPIAEDNCEVSVAQTEGPMPGDSLAPGFYTVTYIASDLAGNMDTCSFVINVLDTQDPLILCPSNDVVIGTDAGVCSWTSPAGSLTPTVAIANCPFEITWTVTNPDGSMSSGSDDVSGYTFSLDTSLVCYFIAETEDPDSNGILMDTCCFLVIVQDDENPMITCPPNSVFNDTDDGEEDCQHTVSGTGLDAVASDNCSIVSLTHDYPGAPVNTTLDGAVFPVGITLITWTAVDTAGNIASCSFTVTVVDNVPPMIVCPADTTINTSAGGTGDCEGQFDWTHPTPTDNCGVTLYQVSYQDPNGIVDGPYSLINPTVTNGSYSFEVGVNTVIYYVEDAEGNTATCSFTVTVVDDEAPEFINCPGDMIIDNDQGFCGAEVNFSDVLAQDNCDATNTLLVEYMLSGAIVQDWTVGQASGIFYPVGTTTVTYRATDDAGNVSETCVFDITVEDNQAPDAICQDINVYLDENGEAGITTADVDAGSYDNCMVDTITISIDSFDCDDVGLNQVTLVVIDTAGNADSCVASVFVMDTIPPVFECPADTIVSECANAVPDFITGLVGTDNCTDVTFEQDPLPGVLVQILPNDTFMVMITAYDENGNSSSCKVNMIAEDSGAGIVWENCPDSIVVGNDPDQCGAFVNWPEPIAFANCSEPQEVQQIAGPAPGTFIPVNQDDPDTVIYEVVGSMGLITCEFPVIVRDVQSPTPVCQDLEVFVGDDCSVTIGADELDGGSSDNCAIDTFLISRDGVTFTDSITFDQDDLDELFHNITLMVVDIYGNSAICVASVFVIDINDPMVICQEDITVNTEPGVCYGKIPDIIPPIDTTENCEPIVNLDQYPEPGLLFGSFHGDSLEVFLIATDIDGNMDTCSLFVYLEDNENPEWLNCPRPPIEVKAMPGMCAAFVNFSLPVADDNCAIDTIIQIDSTGLTSGDMFPVGLTILKWVAIDVAGNVSDTCRLKIFVNDQQEPLIVCPADTTVINDLGECSAVVEGIGPVVEDNCFTAVTFKVEHESSEDTIVTAGGDDASGTEFQHGTSTVTYKVADRPVLLISEVTHELEAVNGGTNPVPPFIQSNSGDDYLEITNYGPATVDVSCLMIERIGGNNSSFVVPDGVILAVGDVLTIHFGEGPDDFANRYFNVSGAADLAQSDPAAYVIGIDTFAMDVVAVNGIDPTGAGNILSVQPTDWSGDLMLATGGSAFRKWAWDSNSDMDYAIANLCMPATIGSLNPDTDLLADNGETASLQSLPGLMNTCTFTVTVEDTELPRCGALVEHSYTGGGGNINSGILLEIPVVVNDQFEVGDVNLVGLNGTHPDVSELTFKLTSPEGTSVVLFEGLCPGFADFNLGLDSDTTTHVSLAPCGPLGGGNSFIPLESLEEFNGEMSQGLWILTIADGTAGNNGTLNAGWTLELFERIPYNQPDVVLDNDPGECGAEFGWQHPYLFDNCGGGTIVVVFTSEDSIGVPFGREIEPGAFDTLFFEVGTTVVTYILTDDSGNVDSCGFSITVIDVEDPTLICPGDITISLAPGECEGSVNFFAATDDNCGIDSLGYSVPPGTLFPIGTTEVVVTVIDVNGNEVTCTFTVTVIEFMPTEFDLTCNDQINVSLDSTCTLELGADMLLEGNNYRCYDNYCVTVVDENGNPIPDNIITLEHVGQTVIATVTDCMGSGNSCWTLVYVEDKLNPVIECPPDTVVSCNQSWDISVTGVPIVLSCEESVTMEFEDEILNNDECGDPRVEIIRTWIVTDESGNFSTCTQNIIVERFHFDQVMFPPDFIHATELDCEDVANDPSLTEPDNTGWPTIDGESVFGDHYCEINIGYWDELLWDANCPTSYEILRNWIIRDECLPLEPGVNPLRHIQSINVKDRKGPVINGYVVPDIAQSTHDCYGWVDLGAFPTDPCSTIGEVSWTIYLLENGLVQRIEQGVLPQDERVELELNKQYVVRFFAEDDCGNSSEELDTFMLNDIVPPVAACDLHTVISLSEDDQYGLTKIDASVFDDGSYDNCGPVTFRAARMNSCIDFDWTTDGAGIDEVPNGIVNSRDRGTIPRPLVPFACCDVGAGPVMVMLEVTDASGNVNTCMVEVEVQDKLAPYIECPPDISVSCEFWFAAEETPGFIDPAEDQLTPVFGNVLDAYEYDHEDRESIVIDDPGNPTLPQPYTWGIDGWAQDNCDVTIDVRVRLFDDCSGESLPPGAPANAVRLVERTFRATDSQGNSTTCRQLIWVVDYEPFYISDQTCNNPDPNDGVIWPCDKEYTTCPDSIPVDYPTIFDDNCSNVGVTYEDLRLDVVPDACYKILRTWTVIDWCHFDANTGEGSWSYEQVIKVQDHDAPEFEECPAGTVVLSVLDSNVTLPANNQVFLGEADPNSSSCSVHVDITHNVEETCSDEVTYDVKVYPFNGSAFLQVVSKTDVPVVEGIASLVLNTANSPLFDIRNNGLPYNDKDDPSDAHRVLWTVEDGCGNINTCEYLIRLEDRKQPTPVCINGLSTVVMPASGEVTIWAADFDASSFDDCTPAAELLFSFSGVTYQPSKTYTCEMIDANGGPSFLEEIWVWDAWGNRDFCTTFIIVDDNEGVCQNPPTATISGAVHTMIDKPVEGVEIHMFNEEMTIPDVQTDINGQYTFENLPFLEDYVISASKNNDHKNGVSTLDLVRIQKHLLGIEQFAMPYQYIAADANNSGSVSALDLLELRKLILGIYEVLPENHSWRFVPVAYTFADPVKPWPFDEVVVYDTLLFNATEGDFVAIKVGDLNNTAAVNLTSVEIRNPGPEMTFQVDDRFVEAGSRVEVPVYTDEEAEILGFQFSLDTRGLKLADLKAGQCAITPDNFGTFNGMITSSWNQASPLKADPATPLFTLVFEVEHAGMLSDKLRMHSNVTRAEAYRLSSTSIEESTLGLEFRTDNTVLEFALYQNSPNPWNGETVIHLTLPDAMPFTIRVTDELGRVIYRAKHEGTAGINQVSLNALHVPADGIYYYSVEAGAFSATKKMIRTK